MHVLDDLGCFSKASLDIANEIKYLSECGVKNNELCIIPNLENYPDALQAGF